MGNVIEFLSSEEVGDTRDRIFDGYQTWFGVPQAEAAQAQAEAEASSATAGALATAEAIDTTVKVVGGVAVLGLVVWWLKSR